MKLLVIEASTYVGSVCVLDADRILAEREVAMRGADEERLMPAVAAALADSGRDLAALDAIVCGEGPGSFTSLRIAASIAKGLALSAEKPLVPVSSLALMLGSAEPPLGPGAYRAVIDALRGELFVADAVIDPAGAIRVGEIELRPAGSVDGDDPRTVGPEAAIEARPRARGASRLLDALRGAAAAELDGWEPRYGRLAEAQVRWEAAHGRSLADG